MVVQTRTFQTIKRPNVVEDVIETFKQGIISGDLQPGQRLPSEVELVEQFGIGRGTLREAMKKLEALGVINIQRGDGTYIVDKPSPTLLNPLIFAIMLEAGQGIELLELRELIEVGYCQLAAQKATAEDWKRIEDAQRAFEEYVRSPQQDVDQLTLLDLGFHFALIEATHNPLVITIAQTVEELFFASIRTALSQLENLNLPIEGHQGIMRGLRTGNPETIRQSVVNSLAHWRAGVGL